MLSSPSMTHKALILDLGDVLFSWKPPKDGKVSPSMLRRIMSSGAWFQFERGQLSEDECFEQAGLTWSVSPTDVKETVDQAKLSLSCDEEFIRTLRTLKEESKGSLKIYAMSNISKPHFDIIQSMGWDFSIFDAVFTSAEAGMRKPDLCFYNHVLKSTGFSQLPENVIFVDDKIENVTSALVLGLHGIQFDNSREVSRKIQRILGDPIKRGNEYLKRHAGNMRSLTNTGIELTENFSNLLILEATKNRDLVNLSDFKDVWNFFQDPDVAISKSYPNDFDTTSIAISVLPITDPVRTRTTLEKAARNVNADGIMQFCDDAQRPRHCPTVCANLLSAFYKASLSKLCEPTRDYVMSVLETRAYLPGTVYYPSPDFFLFAVSRWVHYSTEPLPPNLLPLLRKRCFEAINRPGASLDLATRIIACLRAGVEKTWLQRDLQRLVEMQEGDGGWPWSPMYKTRVVVLELGSRGWNTALAMQAIEMMKEDKENKNYQKSVVQEENRDTAASDGGSEKPSPVKAKTNWRIKMKQLVLCAPRT